MKVYIFHYTQTPVGNNPEELQGASVIWEAVREDCEHSGGNQIWHHSLEQLKDSIYELWGESELILLPEKMLTSSRWYQNKSSDSWKGGQSDLMEQLELSPRMLDSGDWWEKYFNFLKTI